MTDSDYWRQRKAFLLDYARTAEATRKRQQRVARALRGGPLHVAAERLVRGERLRRRLRRWGWNV